jgi:hypothetical protein
VSIVAIRLPPYTVDGVMLHISALYDQRMIFIEPYAEALSTRGPILPNGLGVGDFGRRLR